MTTTTDTGALAANETSSESGSVPQPDQPQALPALPDHVRMTGWNTAEIDLSRWGQGRVKVADPPYKRLADYDDFYDSKDGRRPLFSGGARLCRAFCRGFVSMIGPKWNAELPEWEKWLGDFEASPYEHLVDGIIAFRGRMAKQDVTRGN